MLRLPHHPGDMVGIMCDHWAGRCLSDCFLPFLSETTLLLACFFFLNQLDVTLFCYQLDVILESVTKYPLTFLCPFILSVTICMKYRQLSVSLTLLLK